MNAVRIDGRRGFVRSSLAVLTLVGLFATAHDATAIAPDCEARAMRAHRVLLADSMDNWEPLDDRTVLIWTKHSSRAHLVRVDRALAGLTHAAMLYLVDPDHDGLITPCGRDGIVIGYGVEVTQIARIVSIDLLSAKRTAELDRGSHMRRRGSLRI